MPSRCFLDLSDDVVRLTSDFLHHLSLPRLCRRLWVILSGRHLGCRLWDSTALQRLVVVPEEAAGHRRLTTTTRSLVLHSEPWTELSQSIIWPVLNDRLRTLQGLHLQGLQHLELKQSRCSVIGMEWEHTFAYLTQPGLGATFWNKKRSFSQEGDPPLGAEI